MTQNMLKLIYSYNFKCENSNHRPLKTQAIFINSTEFQNSTIFHKKLKDICSKLNISETKQSHVAGKTAKKQPWPKGQLYQVGARFEPLRMGVLTAVSNLGWIFFFRI